jgi:3-oxoadipate enol-lactonase
LSALAGARELRVDVGGDAALAVVAASGPRAPFVFAHGWMGDRRWWEPVAARLAALGHAVVLYDHRGHGRSSRAGPFDVATLARDLARLVDALELDGAIVAGHSMGGVVAQQLALDHAAGAPCRVRALVLASTACDQRPDAGRWLDVAARATLLSAWLPRIVAHPRIGPRLAGLAHPTFPAEQRAALREMFLATPLDARRACWRALRGFDVRARLAAIELPALVVVGSDDRDTPPASSERLAAALPKSRFESVPGATHALPWEAPDALAALLARFAADL